MLLVASSLACFSGQGLALEAVQVSTLASCNCNGGITVADNGDLYIGEFGNVTGDHGTNVFRVTPTGHVEVFASGLGLSNSGNDFDAQGNLIQSAYASNVVRRIDPQGNATVIASVPGPVGVVAATDGNIYVASCATTSTVKRINTSGQVSTFATNPQFRCTNGLTETPDGNLYAINYGDGKVFRIKPNGNTKLIANLGVAGAHIVYGNGELYAAGRGGNAVYRVTLEGDVTKIAGSGENGNMDGAPLEASFSGPNGIAISNDGHYLYVDGTSDVNLPGGSHFNPIRVVELSSESAPFPINYGHTGSWYNPMTGGQGFSIEVVVDPDTGEPDQLVVYWFTYASSAPGGAETQRWFQAQGPIEGDHAVMDVLQVTGGVFDDPAPVDPAVVGTATATFTSCTEGALEYSLDLDGDGTEETTGLIPIQRLTPDATCSDLAGG